MRRYPQAGGERERERERREIRIRIEEQGWEEGGKQRAEERELECFADAL